VQVVGGDSHALRALWLNLARTPPLANGISSMRGMDWSTYMPGGIAADGERFRRHEQPDNDYVKAAKIWHRQ
jgi:hypothetical protein